MTESTIQLKQKRYITDVPQAIANTAAEFRDRHPDATIVQINTREATSDDTHEHTIIVNGVQ